MTRRAAPAVRWAIVLAAVAAWSSIVLPAGQAPAAQAQAPARADPATGEATFNIFVNATPVGFERVQLSRADDGWIIRASGQVTGPLPSDIRRFELAYDDDWRPLSLAIDGVRTGIPFGLETTIAGGTATGTLTQRDSVEPFETTIDPASIVLPNYIYAPYEALAVRLNGIEPGTDLPVFVAPGGVITLRVNRVGTQRIDTAERTLVATTYSLTFADAERPLGAEVWVDEARRLLRLSIPSASLDVIRQDLSAASSRVTGEPHPGDEPVRVQTDGFSLATTVTAPPADAPPPEADGRAAVVLVPGPASSDRDGTRHGVSILREMAGALADRGLVVARYDRRGTGQSGGRAESAMLEDYADDVRAVVRHLQERDDVNRDRIAVVGHGEGGWIALLATRREGRVAGLVLIAAPAVSGEELVLEQQQMALDQLSLSDAERQERIDLQTRIHRAVLDGDSWEGIPQPLREPADTPWFRSFLAFDPEDSLRRIRQPVLILQGTLDQEMPSRHADRLENIAESRTRRGATVDRVQLEGVNHLLTPAETGSGEEYATLADAQISSSVVEAIVDWIARALPLDN